MTDEQKAAEIVRIAAEFSKGCGNTIVPQRPPETCEECTDQFLNLVLNVLMGHSS